MKHNYILKSLFVFFLTINFCFGQGGNYVPKIIPPSPNAASLGKYGDIPVSYYTGIPNISIPIYEIQDKAGNHSISISYHASGIKVAEEASRVGLGWALNAGGVISRNIIGGDDFDGTSYFGGIELPLGVDYYPTENYQHASGLIAKFSGLGLKEVDLRNAISTKTSSEYEPDIYTFNIGGESGKFLITKMKEVVLQDKKKIKVEMIEGPNNLSYGANVSWKITMENGTIYYFDEKETSIDGNSKFHVNSWYLTKIKSVEGSEIKFNYIIEPNRKVYSQGSISETKVVNVLGKYCKSTDIPNSAPPSRATSNEYSLVYLSEIIFTNGKVVFTYNTDADRRLDVDGDKKLNAISIYKNDPLSSTPTLLKQFSLDYGYFEGGLDIDYIGIGGGSLSKRLKLKSITEKVGNKSLPSHEFTYYEGDNYLDLPAKTSFAIDHWGYFNGKYGNISLIPTFTIFPTSTNIGNEKIHYTGIQTGDERNPDPAYTKAFSLQRIKYPTGGETEFLYESNDYDILNSQMRDFSMFGKNGALDLEGKRKEFNYNIANKNQIQEFEVDISDGITQIGGTLTSINFDTYTRFGNQIPCESLSQNGQIYFEIIGKDANSFYQKVDMLTSTPCINSIKEGCVNKQCTNDITPKSNGVGYVNSFNLKPGKYTIKAFVSNSPTYNVMDMRFTIKYYSPKTNDAGAKGYTGGLRIKTIKTFDGTKTETTNYKYTLAENDGIVRSSGIRMAAPQYSYWEQLLSADADMQCQEYFEVLRRTSNSIFPLNGSASGSVVGYSAVSVEKTSENNSLGKTVYYYDNKPDVVNNYGYNRTPQNATVPNEQNGKIIREVVYNSQNKKIKETEFTYSQGNVRPKIVWGLDKRLARYVISGTTIDVEDSFFFYPAIKSTFTYLKEKVEKTFDPMFLTDTTKILVNKEEYTYDDTLFHLKEKITYTSKKLSDGLPQRIQTLFKYPSDFAVTGNVYAGMIGQHNYSPVITEQVNLETITGGSKTFNQTFLKRTAYRKWKDARTINSVAYPILYAPDTIFSQQRKTDSITPEILFLGYDNYANLLKYKEKNGLTTTLSYYTDVNNNKGFLHLPSQKQVGGGVDGQKLSDKTITKYNYYPLIGLKSIEDPNGKKTLYDYDEFSRLRSIILDGDTIKKYTYHYGSQGADYTAIGAVTGITLTPQECKMCCTAEAVASSNSPIVNCSSGQITLIGNGSSTGEDIKYLWTGPNNYTSSLKNPVITGDITKAGGVYTLVVTKSNSTCQTSSTASTKVVLDCICPYTISTAGTTVGPLACQSSISLVSSCSGCSTGELISGTETYVSNGKFDNSSTTGFSSDCATYFTPNPQSFNGTFNSFGNHSSNIGGNMLLIGHSTNNSEKVWYQTIAVQPNTRYILSAWVTSAYDNNGTKVNWEVNGEPLSEVVDMSSKNGGLWQQLKSVWISGNQTSVTIAIRKQNTFGHNWFVLDDISMTNVLPAAKFEWTGPDNFFATGSNATIRNVGLKNGGTYQLKVVSNGCTKISEVNITVNCQPCLDSSPLTVYVNSNSPVSCGSPITLFASANKRNVSYTWYKLNPDGSDIIFPDTEKNKQNPTITAPSTTGINRYGYMVAAFKDGCTASYTTPVEVKCIPNGDVDISMSLRTESGVTTVTNGQQFGICADITNSSTTRGSESVRVKVLLPDCLEFTGPTWGSFYTGSVEGMSGHYYEDIWYSPITKEVSNLSSQERRGTETWRYWGTYLGESQTRTMCFQVKALSSGPIVVKGQVAVIENTSAQNMKDSDSEPDNGYDNGEDDRAILTLGSGTNTLNVSHNQLRTSFSSNTSEVDVISVNSNWTATPSHSWITMNKLAGGNGTSTILVSLSTNNSPSSRFGTITISGGCGFERIIKVKQAGKGDCPTVDLSSNNPYCSEQLKLFANLVPSTNKDLVTNGNFEKGNVDFSPEEFHYYNWETGGSLAYVVSANPKTENGSTGMWFIDKECPDENINPTCKIVNRVRLLFRADCCLERLDGARIQGSNDKNSWTTLYTFGNATGNWQDVSFNNTLKYAYVRFVSGSEGYGEVREIEFYAGTTKLSGQIFGSTGIWGNNVLANAMDGSEYNLWHGAVKGESNFVGLELSGCTFIGAADNDTRGYGKQMAVAASWRQRGTFWSQTILVDPNTDYTISVKATQLGNYDDVPVKLLFDIDGVPTNVEGTISTTGCSWQKISGVWNSGESFGPVKLSIRFLNPNFNGKFFAIDDISVKPVSQGVTSSNPITYSWTAPNAGIQGDLIAANSSTPIINNVKGKHSGIYTLTASQNNCSVTESIDVDIACTPLSCPSPIVKSPWARVCINMNQKATLNAIGCPLGSVVRWSDGQTSTPQTYTDPSNGAVTTISTIQTASIKQGAYFFAQCQTDCGISSKSNDLYVHAVETPVAPKINPQGTIEKAPGDDGTILFASGCSDGIIKWSNGTTGSSTWISPLGFKVGDYVEVTAKCITDCGESPSSNKVKIIVSCGVTNPTYAKAIDVPNCTVNGGLVTLDGACNRGNVVWYKEGDPSFMLVGNTVKAYASGDVTFRARCETSLYCVSEMISIPVSIGIKSNSPTISSIPSNVENSSNITVKVNTTVSLTANACPVGSTVAWTLTGYSPNSSNSKTISITPTAVGQITAQAICSGQCASDPSSIVINVESTPPSCPEVAWSITPSTGALSLVQNSTQNLGASGCTSGNIKWYVGNVEKTSTNNGSSVNVAINTNTIGTYNYTAVCSVGSCTYTKAVAVTITPPSCNLLVSTNSTSVACGSTDVQCSVTKNGTSYSNVQYTWYYRQRNTTSDGSQIGITNKITVLQNGNEYKVKVVDISNSSCVANSAWLPVAVNSTSTQSSTFAISPAGNNLSVVKNSTQNLSASGCTSGLVEWYLDGIKQFGGTTQPLSISVNTSIVGVYNYTANCTVGACVFPKNITVTVNEIPCALSVALSKTKACGSTDFKATALKSGSAYTGVQYKWYYRPNNTTTQSLLTTTTANYSATKSGENGIGEFKVEVNENNCVASSQWVSDTIMKKITQTPTASGSVTIARGSTANLSASGCPIGSDYVWYDQSGEIVQSPVSPLNTTYYYVRCKILKNSSVCESDISNVVTVTVTVSCAVSLPKIEYDTPLSKVCPGASIKLKASCPSGSTVNWYNTKSATSPIATGATYTTTSRVIWATCKSSSSCESLKDSIVTQTDFGKISITPNCDFNRFDVTPLDVDAYTYRWKQDNVLLSATTPYLDNITTGGTFVVEITKKGTTCLQSTAYTLNLPISGYPTVSLNSTDSCGRVQLSAVVGNTTNAGLPYKASWFKDGYLLDVPNTLQYMATSSGKYKVEVTAHNGCNQSIEKNVIVNNKPTKPTISKTSSCYYSGSAIGVSLTANCPSGSTPEWDNNLGSNAKITVSPSVSTTYKVRCLTGICASDWEQTVITICPPSPEICNLSISSPKDNNTYFTKTINYSGGSRALNLRFETYCVPDRLVVSVNGSVVVDGVCLGSGVTSQSNPTAIKRDYEDYTINVNNNDVIKIEVHSNCTDKYSCSENTISNWYLTFSCPFNN